VAADRGWRGQGAVGFIRGVIDLRRLGARGAAGVDEQGRATGLAHGALRRGRAAVDPDPDMRTVEGEDVAPGVRDLAKI